MTFSITNRTTKKLRVVLPPGLIASGNTGQFGGMGMGMGGMGMMGGGMGMMSGMGMMGGGMGMMGGGMGMMGGGMGMMGGGMGMMGGRGGGFRSVPPTGLLEATFQPRQVRHLPTAVVSLNGPSAEGRPVVPAKGEHLELSAIEQWTDDTRTCDALRRLAQVKAPPTVAQMVLWYVTAGADWEDVGRLAQGWGNAHEIELARRFVGRLGTTDAPPAGTDPGVLYWEVQAEGDAEQAFIDGLRAFWTRYPVLGLTAREHVPPRPAGPALSCRIALSAAAADVTLAASHPSGSG